MIFPLFGKKKKKNKKKDKRKKLIERNRRMFIILEARKHHERNRKKAKEELAKGGWGETTTMEQDDLGFAVASGVVKGITMSGNALEKMKKMHRKLNKSRSSNLKKLQAAKKKMKGRSRA